MPEPVCEEEEEEGRNGKRKVKRGEERGYRRTVSNWDGPRRLQEKRGMRTWAQHMRSMQRSASGMAWRWMGVGFEYRIRLTLRCRKAGVLLRAG